MNELAERIRSVRSIAPSEAVTADPMTARSDRELLAAADELAVVVRTLTPNPSPMVAATLPLSVDAIVVLLAAILHDYSVCFLDPAAAAEKRRSITAALRPDVVIDENGAGTVSDQSGPPGPRSDKPGYVAMSSGSTGGGPKGVLSAWSTIASFAPFGAAALELDREASWAEISHPSYDMAITNLLLALASGATVHVSSALGDRVRPLRFVDRVGATHLRLAPRFVDLAAAERRPPDGRALRLWGSGGDRLFASQAKQVFDFGAPTLVNTYGTSETAGFASAARLESTDTLSALHGGVTIGTGEMGPWRASLVQQDADSMLAIETPYRPSGYLIGESSGDFPRWEGADVVMTGDSGARIGDELFCLGRAGRRVKRNATFVDLDGVDATIRSHRAVVSFTVATPDGALASLVEAKPDDAERLHRSLASLLSPDVMPDRVIPIPQLPRLGNGKIDHAAAHALAEGST
jgi:acyl-CoA synthetase (AMP-forming)/AMP-acid ligase II